MHFHKYFGDRRFYKTALAVALPIMVQNGITNFVGMLDNIMVGRVGTVEMTGVSIANTILFVFNLAVFGAVSGAGIFGAQFFGKGDMDGVRSAFRFKLLECAAILVLGTGIFLCFGSDLMELYLRGEGDQSHIADSLRFGERYLRIMLLGLPAFALAQCYAGTLRESGQTVVPMTAGLVAVVVNCFCNWVLIFGKLGLPRLGTDGAAIATVLSRFVEAATVVERSTHLIAHRIPETSQFQSIMIAQLDILRQGEVLHISHLRICAMHRSRNVGLGHTVSFGHHIRRVYGVGGSLVNHDETVVFRGSAAEPEKIILLATDKIFGGNRHGDAELFFNLFLHSRIVQFAVGVLQPRQIIVIHDFNNLILMLQEEGEAGIQIVATNLHQNLRICIRILLYLKRIARIMLFAVKLHDVAMAGE